MAVIIVAVAGGSVLSWHVYLWYGKLVADVHAGPCFWGSCCLGPTSPAGQMPRSLFHFSKDYYCVIRPNIR